jgi:hypothetical protein
MLSITKNLEASIYNLELHPLLLGFHPKETDHGT